MKPRFFAVIASLLMLVTAGCGWFGDDLPPLEEGYRYLFDGKTLGGWYPIGGEATFTVEDGDIVGRYGPGDNSFLRTDGEFTDFIVKMDFKWDEPGNSGVLFRANQRPEGHKYAGRAYGYQLELDHTDRAWSGGIYDEARRGWLFDLEDLPDARAAIKPDDWNELTIEAIGGILKTFINGVPVATVADALDLEGFIALQVHSGKEGVMRWRNIRIKELGQSAWQTDGIATIEDWKVNGGSLRETDTGLEVIGESGPVSLLSRRQYGDFALRFTLPLCEQPSTLLVRRSQLNGGAKLQVKTGAASLGLAEGEVQDTLELSDELEQVDILLTAVGEQLRVNIGEVQLGVIDKAGVMAERGKLHFEISPCTENASLASIAWLDLKPKSTEKLFYQTLDNAPAIPLTPDEALAAFKVAPGFKVELVAAEPLVAAPVAMDWDEDGRLYVVEMRGFMPDAYGEGQEEPVGRVVRLEDTNGDGRMDTSEIYLDGLVNPRAVKVVNQGVLIAEPPALWLCKGKANTCTDKVRVSAYGEGEDNIEHLENGLMQGLDNWLYNAKSTRRLRFVGDAMVEEETAFRGQWGIAQDSAGRIYHNHNSAFINGDFFPAEYVLALARTGEAAGISAPVSTSPGVKEEVFSIRVNPGVNRAYLDGVLKEDGRLASPTAVSGLVVNRGDQFPAEYSEDFFVPEPAANVVAHFRRKVDGITVSAEHQTYADQQWGQREFLASTDERFRPVDAKVGPDGALYVIDMYRGIIQETAFLTDELREQVFQRGLDSPLGLGRIWRVVHTDSDIRRTSPALAGSNKEQLVATLSHPNGWQRDTAQRLLLAQPDAVNGLRELAASGSGPGAIHALWTLRGLGALDSSTLLAALQGEPAVQLQALRAGIDNLELGTLLKLAPGLKTIPLQQQMVFNLGHHRADPRAQNQLLSILSAKLNSPYIAQAVASAVHGSETEFLALLFNEPKWQLYSKERADILKQLAQGAYLAIRDDIASSDMAPAALQDVLLLAQSQSGEQAWRQIAMLEGFEVVTRRNGFTPARLAEVPAIFSDTSVDETDPLWDARLSGRRAFTWEGDELAAGLVPLSPNQMALMQKGEKLYAGCGACHGATGQGTVGLAPTLVGTEWVEGPPEWLARIILQGLSGPLEVNGEQWNGVMPGHATLPGFDDEGVAGLMIYMRRSWGNSADPVTSSQVASVREQTQQRSSPWTVAELREVPFDQGFDKYVGNYKVSFVKFSIFMEDNALHMKVPMYGGGVLEQVGEHRFQSSSGDDMIDLEFELAKDGSVPAMILYRDGQKIRAERVD